MERVTLRDIKAWLRRGRRPELFPGSEYLYGGCQRNVYRIGDYVVKTNCGPCWRTVGLADDVFPHFSVPVRWLRRFDIKRPRQWFVGEWVIQPFYQQSPCGDSARTPKLRTYVNNKDDHTVKWYSPLMQHGIGGNLDLHEGNLAKDRHGNTVAIDW